MFKFCVTIWWTIHSLSSSAIICIVKHQILRMKAFIWSTSVLVLREAGRPGRDFSPIYKVYVLPKYFSKWYRIIAIWIFLYVSTAPSPAWHKTWLHNVAWDSSSPPFLWCCNKTYIYMNHNRTTRIHASKLKLGLKVKERDVAIISQCSWHCSVTSSCTTKLISFLVNTSHTASCQTTQKTLFPTDPSLLLMCWWAVS
jgi:hypothetical protein